MYNAAAVRLERNQNRGGPKTVVNAMAGGDGIKRKVCSMKGFITYSKEDRIENDVELDKTQILIGKSAVNAGVSSNDFPHCKHKDSPPTMYGLCQEMGHVNWAISGPNTYGIHVSFDCASSLYVCIMKNLSTNERKQLLLNIQEVLSLWDSSCPTDVITLTLSGTLK